jgi:flagellar basal-body rod protein FlgB
MLVMDLGDIPLFAMLRGRLGYLSESQRLIAQNVANADTPGFKPSDLKPFTVHSSDLPPVVMAPVPQPVNMIPVAPRSGAASAFKAKRGQDSETTLDGNSVVLEEEMMKLTDARMNYDAAIGFYNKSLNLLRLAVRSPGHG